MIFKYVCKACQYLSNFCRLRCGKKKKKSKKKSKTKRNSRSPGHFHTFALWLDQGVQREEGESLISKHFHFNPNNQKSYFSYIHTDTE